MAIIRYGDRDSTTISIYLTVSISIYNVKKYNSIYCLSNNKIKKNTISQKIIYFNPYMIVKSLGTYSQPH